MCTADSVDLSEEMVATGSVGLGFSCGPRVPGVEDTIYCAMVGD